MPLALPPSRSGIPVPIQIAYQGTTRAGAAGSGWDIPLSYVRVSSSTMRRKPSVENSGWVPSSAPTRVFLALDGAPTLMVRSKTPGRYVPFAADAYMELTQVGTQWRLEVMGGRRYWFTSAYEMGGKDFPDPSLWLLTKVEDLAAKDQLNVTYEISPIDGVSGCSEITLQTVHHTYDAKKTPLFEIKLEYEKRDRLIAKDLDEGFCTGRTKTVDRVTVSARDNVATGVTGLEPIRVYDFEYEDVVETTLPRLVGVTVSGEGGEGTLKLVGYAYAPQSEQWGDPVVVKRSYTVPGGGSEGARYAGSLATTERAVEHLEQTGGIGGHRRKVFATVEHLYTRHLIRDFTGDGVPDLVFKSGPKWVLRPGTATDSGTQFGAAYTWTQPSEIFEQTTTRFGVAPTDVVDHTTNADMQLAQQLAHDAMVTTETWVQFLDWNGDGRMDVVDARHGDEKYFWKIWINEGVSNGQLVWRPENVFIDELRFAGDDPDHPFADLQDIADEITEVADLDPLNIGSKGRFPLERARSWPWMHWVSRSCYTKQMIETECVYTSPDGQQGPYPDVGAWTYQTDTLTEWRLVDVNGDRYPDFVKNRRAASRCAKDQPSYFSLEEGHVVDDCPNLHFTACMSRSEHWEYPTGGACPNHDPYDRRRDLAHDVYLNIGGALFPQYQYKGDLFRWSGKRSGAIDEWANGEMFTVQVDPESGLPVDSTLPSGESPSRQLRAYVDLNGDGLPELHDFGGGGSASSWNYAARFVTNRDEVCDGWGTENHEIYSRQIEGLVDINGDGIPDRVWLEHGEDWVDPGIDPGPAPEPIPGEYRWWVQYGNGVDYGPSRALPDDFELSRSRGTCSTIAQTIAGIEDLDGDGKPELLRVDNGDLLVRKLIPLGMTDLADAGRLITVYNGQEARTRIGYGNNKTETQTAHQVPFPEIVVRKTWTEHPDGADAVHETHYAYGNAKLTYDPVLARWSFPGYQRVVAVIGDPKGSEVSGVGVITDRSPAAPPGSTHAEHLKAGRVVQTTRLEGALPADPRWLLTIDVNTTTKARAGARIDYDVIKLDTESASGGEECFDANGSTGAYPIGDSSLCQRGGIVVAWNTTQWEGMAAPPTTANEWRGGYIETYDTLGRPTKLVDLGDVRQSEDDTCTFITYAQPTNDNARLRMDPSAIWVTDCGLEHVPSPTGTLILAGTRFVYDGLPEGQVSDGRLTSTIVERYDGVGTLLGQYVAQQTEYEPDLALPRRILRARSIGTSALQTTELEFDRYGATLKTSKSSATDVGVQLVDEISAPIWPSKEVRVKAV